MSTSVYAWDSNPAIDRRLYPISNKRAQEDVLNGRAKFIVIASGRKAIQMLPPVRVEKISVEKMESIGLSNLIPFGRSQNPMLAPQRLHYEVPMAGDRTCYARHHRRRIRVSTRSLFSQPGVQWANYARQEAKALRERQSKALSA